MAHFASIMTLNNFEIIQKLQTLHFQMTFLLSSTSSLVKLLIISCFPAIANDHKASNGAIHHSCCSVHVIKFFKQSGRSPIELKLCSVTNRQDTIIPDAFFFSFFGFRLRIAREKQYQLLTLRYCQIMQHKKE